MVHQLFQGYFISGSKWVQTIHNEDGPLGPTGVEPYIGIFAHCSGKGHINYSPLYLFNKRRGRRLINLDQNSTVSTNPELIDDARSVFTLNRKDGANHYLSLRSELLFLQHLQPIVQKT